MDVLSLCIVISSVFAFDLQLTTSQDAFLAATITDPTLHDVGIIDLQTKSTKKLSLQNLLEPTGIDYDPIDDKIYFSDRRLDLIGRANLDGSNQEVVLRFDKNNTLLEQIALNPWSRLLFWVDSEKGAIFVSNLGFTIWKRLIGNLKKPRGLVADLQNSYIYWTEWENFDIGPGKLTRATMAGTNIQILVQEDIQWPNGIALDKQDHRIYWCDAYFDRIESIHIDGSNRTVYLESSPYLNHAHSVAVDGASIYWTDALQRAVVVANRTTREVKTISIGGMFGLGYGLMVSSSSEMIGTDQCSANNGGCFQAHLCLPKPSGRECVCLENDDDDDPTCFFYKLNAPTTPRVVQENTDNIIIVSCPGDITITVPTEKDAVTVTWIEPVGSTADEGTILIAEQSHQPGDYFQIGTSKVIYVYHFDRDTKICSFNIIIWGTTPTETSDAKVTFDLFELPLWVNIGAGVLLFILVVIFLSICMTFCRWRTRETSSRRDGNLVAMETSNVDNYPNVNTITSQVGLTATGRFQKQDKKKIRRQTIERKKRKAEKGKDCINLPTIPETLRDVPDIPANRFKDSKTNFENTRKFNTLR